MRITLIDIPYFVSEKIINIGAPLNARARTRTTGLNL